jgi:hypothetical protein
VHGAFQPLRTLRNFEASKKQIEKTVKKQIEKTNRPEPQKHRAHKAHSDSGSKKKRIVCFLEQRSNGDKVPRVSPSPLRLQLR